MANEDSVLREVDQELAEDQLWTQIRRYGPAIVGAGLALVIGVGAMQVYTHFKTSAAEQQAVEFSSAVETLAENPEDGRAAFEAIASETSGGYSVLADFRRAASLAAEGQEKDAEAIFTSIYQSGSAPKAMRELARLRAAYLALNDNRDAVLMHLGDLQTSASPFRPYAEEAAALAALTAEDYEAAYETFVRLAADPTSPEPIAARADELAALALTAKSGVNITGGVSLDDVLSAVKGGEIAEDGHDHGVEEGNHAEDEPVDEAAPAEAAPAEAPAEATETESETE